MKKSRRTFLEELVAAGLVTGAIASEAEARPLFDDPVLEAFQDREPNNREFWKGFFDSLDPAKRGGGAKLQAQNRKVQYLHLSEGNGLRYLNDIRQDELLDYDGDVVVTAELGQFRPGAEDQDDLANFKSSSLRVDFAQTEKFMNILAPMAWAALAVFAHDKANKLPTLSQLGFQKEFRPGDVLLPGGTAKFALNVYPVKPESTFHKFLKILVPTLIATAPVLNLPAISVPVLKMVTELFLGPKGEESHGPPILNSLPVRWCATKRGFAEAREVDKFPLVDGNYIMVPQAHADELGKSIGALDWQRGFLVKRDAPTASSPDQRALDAIPGVTYVSMNLKVTKVPQNSGSGSSRQTTGGSEETPTDGGGGKKPSGGGGNPKPGATPRPSVTPTPRRTPGDE